MRTPPLFLPSLLRTFSICFKHQFSPHSRSIFHFLKLLDSKRWNRTCSIIAREERSVTFELLNNWRPSVATSRWRSPARSSVYQCDKLWYQYGGSYGSIINGGAAFVNLTFIYQKHEGHSGPWSFALVEMTELHMGYFQILKSVLFFRKTNYNIFFLEKKNLSPHIK